ncbi:alpha-amylase family glycosyl hydrolase [Nitrospirillum amazonense]|uniref:alpha-amylase family glycosyl hydrolase n=1 Tax=Nitrospirillum amazonense TaxID=28077 RepID=UPI002412B7A3|nr:alpha-amylase family glycosyl hydrolase [Nitrospirillum amazonense]MDG3442593.1 alpha-amylase family glycosyl hydrolase [Nitrospirillum amazonense]
MTSSVLSRAAALDDRLDRHWPVADTLLRRLYGGTPGPDHWPNRWLDRWLDHWLGQVREAVTRAARNRPQALADLDTRRQAEPDWFQRPDQLGYCFYVDRFAGTLAGVRRRLDYLAELGVTYLHPLPLLAMQSGDNDGGFAVADYRSVEPRLGTAEDLRALAEDAHQAGMALCLDVVCNHTARDHAWAQAALVGDPTYRAYYHVLDSADEVAAYEATLGQVFPKTAPGNFTPEPSLARDGGGAWVWTTFYPYQWDLNYANPAVFLEMLEVLLHLANQGVDVFRLDSTPFLWKAPGTSCRGLPQTHWIVQAWRALLAIAAPGVLLKGEAIVDPDDVVSFFGRDEATGQPAANECHLAYNNGMMTALWLAQATGDATPAHALLDRLAGRPRQAAWITYVRCHDDIIWDALAALIPQETLHRVSAFYAGATAGSYALGAAFQADGGGAPSTNGMAASLVGLRPEGHPGEADTDAALARLLQLYQVTLALDGLPVLYMGDEVALTNAPVASVPAGEGRWLHRPHMDWDRAAQRGGGTAAGMFRAALRRLIQVRAGLPALHGAEPARPLAGLPGGVLGFQRTGSRPLLCLANLMGETVTVSLPTGFAGRDVVAEEDVDPAALPLGPWQTRWIEVRS